MTEHPLKPLERKLAKHVAAGHGKETEKSLHDKSNDKDLDARELFSNKEYIAAREAQRSADYYDDLRSDVKAGKKAIASHGHDMSIHGEGKPYGEK